MFDEHLADRWRDEAPKLLHTDDGNDVWTFNGALIPNVGLNAVAGRPKEEYGIEPTSFEEIRPGCYDIDERIKGHGRWRSTWVNVLPIVSGLCRSTICRPPRKGKIRGCPHPGLQRLAHPRMVWFLSRAVHPHGSPMIWSAEECAAEVRRVPNWAATQ
ncbi:MAG: hypothetical protein Ct9H300mP12_10870 [Acidimicrobiales bacterium]|nr:MAG: hypothetical protein Ct9H300mP12_10870 [Acidimicrobiales bacterium]